MLVQISDYIYVNTQYITSIKLNADASTVYFVGEPNGCVYSRSEGEILLKAMQAPAQKDLDAIRKAIVSYAQAYSEEAILSSAGVGHDDSNTMLDDIIDTIKGGLYGI